MHLMLALLLSFDPSPAPAVTPPPAMAAAVALARSRVETMLRTGSADATWFSSDFLGQISIAQVNGVLTNLLKTMGPFQSLEYTPQKFVAHFAKGTDDVLIHLDSDNKIDGLLFRPPNVGTGAAP